MEHIPDVLLQDLTHLKKATSKVNKAKGPGFVRGLQKDLSFHSNSSLTESKTGPSESPAPNAKASGPVKTPQTKTVALSNAFVHSSTARRVSHLIQPKLDKTGLEFVYESPNARNDDNLENGNKQLLDPLEFIENKGTSMNTDHMKITDSMDGAFPSLKPVTRKEVNALNQTMVTLLNSIGANTNQIYPSEMHAFLAIINEEQKIYDTVLQEIIRQVTINMSERGELLAEVRRRYASMFVKIPRHVKHLHTELVAQRKLNRRLSEEVVRAKETVAALIKELDFVRKHDNEVSKQAQETQEKLVAILTQSDNTDEILEEYHKLYRMQRDRLEEALRLAEQEKRIWVDASTSLAIRIGQEHGIIEIIQLQKYENGRLRATNDMIVRINNSNDDEINSIERKINDWRKKLLHLSQSVIDEDKMNTEILATIQREMKIFHKNLIANEPTDHIEADHPLLKVFHIYDARSVSDHLSNWADQIATIANRFTSDRDIALQEETSAIRKTTEQWIQLGGEVLRRNMKSTSGKDYAPISETLGHLAIDIEQWLAKIDRRVSGEDGIATQIIGLQNQVDDRCTAYGTRDMDKPLPAADRAILRDNLFNWIEQITILTEKEQHKIPLHVENWLSKLVDQINTDTDVRTEDNLKLHTSMVSWMVHLLVKGGKEDASEAWDHEFHLLSHELASFNQNLVRDATDIDMSSHGDTDLKKIVQSNCDNWLLTAKKLLIIEKKNVERRKAGVLKTTSLSKSQQDLLNEVT